MDCDLLVGFVCGVHIRFGLGGGLNSHADGHKLGECSGSQFLKPKQVDVRGLTCNREVFFGQECGIPNGSSGKLAFNFDFKEIQFCFHSVHFVLGFSPA